ATPYHRVHTIRADDEVGVCASFQVINRIEVLRLDTYGTCSCLQDLQQPQAANAGVAHAVDADFLALVYDDAVVAVLESRPARCQRVRVFVVEELKSALRELQSGAEGGIGWCLREALSLPFGFGALEQISGIKTGRC